MTCDKMPITYMFFAVFEDTYNVIITLRNIRITNYALGVQIDEPLGRHSHALILRVITIHYM